jgi:hypothetical protein
MQTRKRADGHRWRQSGQRGQSLVEFALVLPILLVLLLGVADFGRVFTAGITLEAAARDAAEAAAQEYTQIARLRPLTAADYDHLHEVAITQVCHEARTLPNATFLAADPSATPPRLLDSCPGMPVIAVCVHDVAAADPNCGLTGSSNIPAQSVPASCTKISGWTSPTPSDAAPAPLSTEPLPYVEVRICYRFTTLFNLTNIRLGLGSGLSLGEVWLQRDREFVVGDY